MRGRVTDRTWSAYVETAEQGRKPAEVARELGMKSRRGLPGEVQRHHRSCGGRSRSCKVSLETRCRHGRLSGPRGAPPILDPGRFSRSRADRADRGARRDVSVVPGSPGRLDGRRGPPGTTHALAARLPHLQAPGFRGVRRGLAGPGPEPAAGRGGEDAQGRRGRRKSAPGRWRPSARTPTCWPRSSIPTSCGCMPG